MQRHPLLFDLDGTLVDSLPDIAQSVNHIRGLHGMAQKDLAAVREMVGDGAIMLVERALEGAPAGVTRESIWPDYVAHHREQCTKLVVPYPGVVHNLGRGHTAGHPMAVVTNKPVAFAVLILEHLDLAKYFGCVIGGDTLAERKPSPAPILEALRRLGRPIDVPANERGLMIGDGWQDIRAGKAAGVRTAAALFGFSSSEALHRENADEYWSHFGGVCPVE